MDNFTTGSTDGDVMIQMRSGEGLPRVKLFFNRDAAFSVEVRPHEGRKVWQETKTTLAQPGQQLVISGTCKGRELDIMMLNCRAEGLPSAPTPTPQPQKAWSKAAPTPRPHPAASPKS